MQLKNKFSEDEVVDDGSGRVLSNAFDDIFSKRGDMLIHRTPAIAQSRHRSPQRSFHGTKQEAHTTNMVDGLLFEEEKEQSLLIVNDRDHANFREGLGVVAIICGGNDLRKLLNQKWADIGEDSDTWKRMLG
ncbi:hypothetical protein PIB30_010360 [Stylosanthes scabra]|uniref:Uncharacterized protein n=1 Tax=Stylosanthes scabra TaxID=79078 RepID=A0ABU6W512_9FABA|nr:hypothetical protein [Stylosanthes scabra]